MAAAAADSMAVAQADPMAAITAAKDRPTEERAEGCPEAAPKAWAAKRHRAVQSAVPPTDEPIPRPDGIRSADLHQDDLQPNDLQQEDPAA